uniref:Uncharacterized protein n=1 Tax=Glossina morsitans morsitans TaxID=37546 RepID=A0A1B0FC95_GLOMM
MEKKREKLNEELDRMREETIKERRRLRQANVDERRNMEDVGGGRSPNSKRIMSLLLPRRTMNWRIMSLLLPRRTMNWRIMSLLGFEESTTSARVEKRRAGEIDDIYNEEPTTSAEAAQRLKARRLQPFDADEPADRVVPNIQRLREVVSKLSAHDKIVQLHFDEVYTDQTTVYSRAEDRLYGCDRESRQTILIWQNDILKEHVQTQDHVINDALI